MALTQALIRELGEAEGYRDYISHIRTQIDHLSTLMKDLLELGRPVEKKNFTRIPPKALCEEAIKMAAEGADGAVESRIRFSADTADTRGMIFGNRTRLTQVFINLLSNAIAHSPPDREIEVTIQQASKNFFLIRVIDRGEGVPEQNLKRIFDPFFTTRKNGTGLGLSIIRHTVESHGGRISIRNNPDAPGCTAEVRLPLSEDEIQ